MIYISKTTDGKADLLKDVAQFNYILRSLHSNCAAVAA